MDTIHNIMSDVEQNSNEKDRVFLTEHQTPDEERRTTLSLSITVSDKKALKMLAAKRETTIAAIIHEWVQEHTKVVSE